MAAVDMTADMPMTWDMWDHVSTADPGEWLVMHEGWRSQPPDEITEGTQVGVARPGARGRDLDGDHMGPPHECRVGQGRDNHGVTLASHQRRHSACVWSGRTSTGPVGSQRLSTGVCRGH
jgi:hypothetical protein